MINVLFILKNEYLNNERLVINFIYVFLSKLFIRII